MLPIVLFWALFSERSTGWTTSLPAVGWGVTAFLAFSSLTYFIPFLNERGHPLSDPTESVFWKPGQWIWFSLIGLLGLCVRPPLTRKHAFSPDMCVFIGFLIAVCRWLLNGISHSNYAFDPSGDFRATALVIGVASMEGNWVGHKDCRGGDDALNS
jgi:hypothetical protein